ncbi:hypothetical protein DSCOOX_13840 [Desulfosarcina ovata subsp. ovata]|uniref:Lipoprotein n=3 Tax=Desulfosarcina ovata TaxID=83564 RepID=A0A5K8A761_9BACT|nr:hypothetical protein DSCOOX_13840 [Desulfosarcina ovata subsp. ovata]
MFLVVALLMAGCSGATHDLYRSAAGNVHAVVQSESPIPMNRNNDRGVRLPLSSRSSMNIDVECIIDYVQGESELTPQEEWQQTSTPWVRFNFTF